MFIQLPRACVNPPRPITRVAFHLEDRRAVYEKDTQHLTPIWRSLSTIRRRSKSVRISHVRAMQGRLLNTAIHPPEPHEYTIESISLPWLSQPRVDQAKHPSLPFPSLHHTLSFPRSVRPVTSHSTKKRCLPVDRSAGLES